MTDLNLIYRRIDDNLLSSPLADEVVMMNVLTGDYLGMNNVATFIWNLLAEPISGNEICSNLLEEYDIDEASCQSKTAEFLAKLEADKLIKIHS